MPERECIVLARIHEEDAEQGMALRRSGGAKIKFGQSVAERSGGTFEIRRARTNLGASLADGASGDKGFVAVQLETYPAHRGAQESGAGIVHVQRVDAAEVHGDGGRGIHDKLTWRIPDGGVNRAALEREALAARTIGDQAEPRAGVDFDAARFIQRN